MRCLFLGYHPSRLVKITAQEVKNITVYDTLLYPPVPSVWCDQPSQGICNKDFLSIKMFLLEPDNDNCRGDIYYKCLTSQLAQTTGQLRKICFQHFSVSVSDLMLQLQLTTISAFLALGTHAEYYTTIKTEFPLFIWMIQSTVS